MRYAAVLVGIFLLSLISTGRASADPNSPVSVVAAPEGQGAIFLPAGLTVADLEQDYTLEEHFVSGKATVYTYNEVPVPGEIIPLDPNLPYTVRIFIRRPSDPDDFNGTVVIEWLNSTAGFDTSPVWHASAEYFARKGMVYVGYTNSTTTIGHLEGGCLFLGLLPPPACGTRYSALSLPENGAAFEAGSQIAKMLKSSDAQNPLFPDFPAERIFHAGQSQQGGSMVTYATAFHFPGVNDGYFVQAAGSARRINFGTPCEDPNAPAYPDCTPTLQGPDRRVATDLPVPVYRVHAETDLASGISDDTRQIDTETFRYYETAGTAHITIHKGDAVIPVGVLGLTDPIFLQELCVFELNTLADGPIFGSYLYNAMWDAMEKQVVFTRAPPSGDLLEVDPNNQIARDAFGNAKGGIRLPRLDLPTATYSPRNSVDPNLPAELAGLGNLFCILSGKVERFDQVTRDTLYPDWPDFVAQFNQKIDDLIAARFLLSEDAAKLRLAVQNEDQQGCIVELNKNFGKVAKAQGKLNCTCIKDGAKGKLSGTIEECITADSKGKVDKAKQKTIKKAQTICTDSPPDFGPGDPNTVNQMAMTKELDLIRDIFGSDLDSTIVDFNADKDGAKCQLEVAKLAKKCQDAKLKEFLACKRSGLKDASIHDLLTLAACMGEDPRGKIEKVCGSKFIDKIKKKCGSDYVSLFPGSCSSEATLTEFATCVEVRVECRVCLGLNAADHLARNCDDFDDGNLNASCP